MVWAQNIKNVTLRQFGTGVSNINAIAELAKKDLGLTLQMTALDTDSTAQRVVTQPKGFDIADIEYFTLKKVWGAGNLQPMDISRLQQFDKIVGIFKDGKLTPTSKIAQGTAPHTVSFVEKPGDKKFTAGMTNWYTMVPTIYNADTLGIRPDLIGRPIGSWTELLNPEFKGKASILNIASIGIMDATMVCEALGEVQYGDKGNMTKEEIDKTMAIFTEAKKSGQFRAFWKTFDESVNLMASGEVVIQSMWSPAFLRAPLRTLLRTLLQALLRALKLSQPMRYLQVLPLTLTLVAFLVVPILLIGVVSFWDYNEFELLPDFVWTNYEELFTASVTYTIYFATFKFALLTWIFTFLIGFTVAYFLAFHVHDLKWQIVLFLLCTIPFWTSNIILMQVFRFVVLPIIGPSLVGVGLFGFTLSFDEFARTLLATGVHNTLPLEIFGMTTNATTPVLYALGTVTTGVSFLVIMLCLFFISLMRRRRLKHGTDAGAGMV